MNFTDYTPIIYKQRTSLVFIACEGYYLFWANQEEYSRGTLRDYNLYTHRYLALKRDFATRIE